MRLGCRKSSSMARHTCSSKSQGLPGWDSICQEPHQEHSTPQERVHFPARGPRRDPLLGKALDFVCSVLRQVCGYTQERTPFSVRDSRRDPLLGAARLLRAACSSATLCVRLGASAACRSPLRPPCSITLHPYTDEAMQAGSEQTKIPCLAA